ncbi:MAG: PLP-dependent cysteine synthase family protein [Armatimonadetes bacterium]|nr:PLP-dependent cysteine synthase family protein [Armatimonadota bacterium]MDE2206625.1 PLP-dependent cysteine synthase family protein [Armatimonadota bacterium]
MPSEPMELGAPITALIGNTPLLRFQSLLPPDCQAAVYAKAEWFNPGGSIKDRAAWSIILQGERDGELTPGKTILDATSGNTGIAYALIGAARGYRVTMCLPANANEERKSLLRAYGAEVILTDPGEGTDGAMLRARAMATSDPDRYFYPDQYNNPANWQAHYRTTAPEIWRQTAGRITHFVAGLGTTGTFTGTGRRLRELNPAIELVAVQPDSPLHGLEGIKHLPSSIVPGIYDPTLVTQERSVSTEEARSMARRLAHTEGVLVGPSGGANLAAAVQLALELRAGVVVTVLADGGARYLSDRFWQEE